MRYLGLGEALAIAEAVTETDVETLARSARLDLLDSALHAPQAGVGDGDEDFYPDLVDKAAVLLVRITKNHPLIDGNKRLSWQSLTMFCALNVYDVIATADDVVNTVLAVAAGSTSRPSPSGSSTACAQRPKTSSGRTRRAALRNASRSARPTLRIERKRSRGNARRTATAGGGVRQLGVALDDPLDRHVRLSHPAGTDTPVRALGAARST